MQNFQYTPLIHHQGEKTSYRLVSQDHVKVESFDGQDILRIDPEGLKLLAYEAFKDISFFLRPAHLEQLKSILDDPQASDNDQFVAMSLLQNAVISSALVLPMCQDTGTATIVGYK